LDLKDVLVPELDIEAATTRRLLERVPPDALAWRPHAKSRPLGELAGHIADLPGLFLAHLHEDGLDRATFGFATGTVADIVAAFDRNVARGRAVLGALSDERLLAPWRYTHGARVIFELPRLIVVRTTALNHLIHHRGQLTVCLRLLDVPLPGSYGPTADDPAVPGGQS